MKNGSTLFVQRLTHSGQTEGETMAQNENYLFQGLGR